MLAKSETASMEGEMTFCLPVPAESKVAIGWQCRKKGSHSVKMTRPCCR